MLESQSWRAGGPSYKFSNRTIRSPSARELCQIQGYGWIWRIRFRAYEIFSTGNLSNWLFYTLWRSSICLNLKNGGLEASHTSSQIGISGLLQLVSYVKFKVKAGSGGVVFGSMKYFPPVFCRADYFTYLRGPQFASISKMTGWRPVIQVLKSVFYTERTLQCRYPSWHRILLLVQFKVYYVQFLLCIYGKWGTVVPL